MFRSRFSDVVGRQLDLFAVEERDGLLAEIAETKERYDRADRAQAEEAYGDYVDVVDATAEALGDMRNRFARTLDEAAVGDYEAAFDRAARKRWPELGMSL
jgi:hypothetical protein